MTSRGEQYESGSLLPRAITLSRAMRYSQRASSSVSGLLSDGMAVKIRPVWRNCTRQNAAESVSCNLIPYKMKQGINSRRTGNLQRLAGNCPPCAGAVEQQQRRLLGVSGLEIEDFKLKASTNAQLTSQPKPR